MAERLSTITRFFEDELGPLSRQYDWDNSGKQVYLGDTDVSRVCLALDPSEHAIDSAIQAGCELLLTHHPLFFRPIRCLNADDATTAKALKAARAGLSILSYHTSLDVADGGLNDHLVRLFGGKNRGFLKKEGADRYVKFAVFVPKGHEDAVIAAIAEAGGGHIGNYSHCTFRTEGTGTFKPGANTNPAIGTIGELESVNEYRIETIVPETAIGAVVDAVANAHPYEEVAHDIFPLNIEKPWGIGRVAELLPPVGLSDFVERIKKALGIAHVAVNVEPDKTRTVSRYAVVSGSGAGFWKECLKAGADVLVTGDMKHHDALDARAAGVVVVDAGHFATEATYMEYLAELVTEQFGIETIVSREHPAIHHWG